MTLTTATTPDLIAHMETLRAQVMAFYAAYNRDPKSYTEAQSDACHDATVEIGRCTVELKHRLSVMAGVSFERLERVL